MATNSATFGGGAGNTGVPMLVSSGSSTSTSSRTPAQTSALNALISQLSGSAMNIRPNQAARQDTITNAQQQLEDYDKESAFADAQGLINQALAQQMQETMPSIVRAADGAGASASSMRALLTQQAVQQASEAAAAQGANLAVQYGQLNQGNSQVLEALTRADSTELDALLKALALKEEIRSSRERTTLMERDARTNDRKPPVSSRPVTIGSNQGRNQGGTGTGGLAQAVFLPSSNQDASAFFNRDGAIGSGKNNQFSAGPTGNDAALLARMQAGLTPMQTWEGTPVPSDLFNGGFKL